MYVHSSPLQSVHTGSPNIPIQYVHGLIRLNAKHRDDVTLLNTVLLTYSCFLLVAKLRGYPINLLVQIRRVQIKTAQCAYLSQA